MPGSPIDGVLTGVALLEDITSVTIYKIPFEIGNLSKIFKHLSDAGVNIDMISQTPPKGRYVDLSFTACDGELSKIMTVISQLNAEFPGISSGVSSGNAKITFMGETMNGFPGVASFIFSVFSENGVDLNVITTSEKDISVLISGHDAQKISTALEKALKLPIK